MVLAGSGKDDQNPKHRSAPGEGAIFLDGCINALKAENKESE